MTMTDAENEVMAAWCRDAAEHLNEVGLAKGWFIPIEYTDNTDAVEGQDEEAWHKLGQLIDDYDPSSCPVCLWGALGWASTGSPEEQTFSLPDATTQDVQMALTATLLETLAEVDPKFLEQDTNPQMKLVRWNDDHLRTKEEVVTLLNRTADKLAGGN